MKTRITSFFPFLTFSSSLLTSFLPLFLTSLTLLTQSSAFAQIPSSGLVGYWPFNGNANDESGNGNNGTVNGATLTTDRFGNANSAYSFNGSTSTINCSGQSIPQNNSFTISLWIHPNDNGGIQEFLHQNHWPAAFYVGINNGYLRCGDYWQNTGVAIASGVWQHIVIVRNYLSQVAIFLNGNLVATLNSDITLGGSSSNPIVFGKQYGGNTEYYNGVLDDISIYNRALTPAEITQIYTSQTSIVQAPCPTLDTNLQTGLVGYWPFCGNANDESGNGNNGTVNGAALTTDRFGNANSAYSFDGVNDFIQTSNISFANGGDFSISIWVNLAEAYANGFPQHYILANNATGGGAYLNTDGNLSQFGCYEINTTVALNSWHHLVAVKSVINYNLYIDNVFVGVNSNCNTNFINGFPIYFGNSSVNSEFTHGKLDDISIYNRALTPAEISQLYTNPSTTPPVACTPFLGEDQTVCAGTSVTLSASSTSSSAGCPTLPTNLQTGLVGYWPFCGNANDASGNGNNGTVNGATLTTDRFGNTNNAYAFDGVNDYVDFGNLNYISTGVSGEYTVSLWVNPASLGDYPADNLGSLLFGDEIYQNNGVVLSLHNSFGFNVYTVGSNNISICNCVPNLNEWINYTVTQNSNGISLYINGAYDMLLSNSINSETSTPTRIGYFYQLQTRAFHGAIDDLTVYNRALTAAEIQQLYTLGQSTYLWSTGATTATISVTPTTTTTYTCTVTDANGNVCTDSVTVFVPQIEATDLTICAGETTTLSVSGINSTATPSACPTLPTNLQTGLVGYWPFCGNANDASGNGHNGTLIGATLATDRFGNPNSAASAFNVGDMVLLNGVYLNDVTNYTVSLWYKKSAGSAGAGGLYCSSNIYSTNGLRLGLGSNEIAWGAEYMAGGVWSYSNQYSYFDSQWHLLTGVLESTAGQNLSSNNLKVYLDGVLQSVYQLNWGNPAVVTSPVNNGNIVSVLGNESWGNQLSFGGLFDDATIHNRALSASEVQQLYTLGQSTYLWSNGATTPTVNVSPTTTTTYTCIVTTNGVSCTDSVTVVVSNPVIDLGADLTVCGTSTTLTAPSGYDSYLWSNGGTTNTATVTSNGTYSCTVTQGGCSATDAVDVTLVNATVSASDSTICAGETVTLSVPQGGSTNTACAALPTNLQTGLVGYWPFCGNANDASGNGNNGLVNGAALTTDRFGSANGAYSFDGYNDLIRVPHQPNLNLLGDYSISVWLEGNFQNLFNNNWVLIAKRDDAGTCCSPNVPYDFFIPFNSTNYAVPGMAYANGGYSFATPPNNITVPLAGWQNVIITNSSDNLNFFVNGNLVYTTNFPSSLRLPNTSDLLIGSVNREFGAEWMNGKLDDIGTWSRALTAEEIQQLYTLGQTSYIWSNGATTPTINVSPSSTTTYTCTVTTNGVSCTDTVTVVVGNPVASITPNGMVEICEGESIALTANGGVSYLWNTGAPTQSITVNTEAFYTVTVTDENGCTDTESQLVKVNFLPNIGVNNASICPGQSTTLTATGGLSYVWSSATGLSSTTGTTVTASPSTSTVYTVTGTGANGCTNTATAAVAVNALPAATITPATATTFCQGGGVVLNANTGAGLSYQWFNNTVAISGASSASYNANMSGSYTVIVTSTTTCSSTSNSIDVTTVANVNYFADADGDGFGDVATLVSTCVQPQGYVTDNTDCDDNDSSVNTAATEVCNHIDDDCSGAIDDGLVFETYYADNDGDTYGDANNSIYECSQPSGYVTNNTDCNDNDANQNAASSEICNGEDDDCDGTIDNGLIFLDFYSDVDGDGFGAGDVISSCTDLGSGYTTNNTDCDDTNSGVYPGAEELCNSIDDNCDGQTDDGTLTVYFIDNDGDTYGNPSVSILACVQPIGYTPDDNDCNDTDANINPGAEDIGGNGIDENCDGQIDNSILELNASINLFPNPTRSEVNIQINSSIIGNDLFIFDAVGKIVYKQQLLSTQTTIPVSNFADGNYVVRVGEVVKRFVVQK